MTRRKNDYYPTPRGLTLALLDHLPTIKGKIIYEPCSGNDEISAPLGETGSIVYTNDIDPLMPSDTHVDASTGDIPCPADVQWVVTNPPFSHAYEIFKNLMANGAQLPKAVGVALLLRLSFLEPVQKRVSLLTGVPPDVLIVVPRTSFTGDGKTDSVTCAWMVWMLEPPGGDKRIKVYSKEDLKRLEAGE